MKTGQAPNPPDDDSPTGVFIRPAASPRACGSPP